MIASWILGVEPGRRERARMAIAAIPGARLSDWTDPLVVTTESPDADLGRVHQALAAVPGVRTVSMVVAYRDPQAEPA